jgi:hypothetical protein
VVRHGMGGWIRQRPRDGEAPLIHTASLPAKALAPTTNGRPFARDSKLPVRFGACSQPPCNWSCTCRSAAGS